MNIAIIGASNDRTKFGNKSVRAYLKQGYKVFPVHPREETIEGLPAFGSVLDIPEDIDRVSIYLPPQITWNILDDIAEKGTKELFLNPGSESTEVIEKARELGLAPVVACSIVDIGETPASYD
jgi:predicted CoA-binding protein